MKRILQLCIVFGFIGLLCDGAIGQVDFSGAKLTFKKFKGEDLKEANFSGAKLRMVDLSGADLEKANFSGAKLTAVNFSGANLKEANFSGAKLTSANFSGANLEGANLTGANLKSPNLHNTNLTKANLTKANINAPEVLNTNMTGAILIDATLNLMPIQKNFDNLKVVGVDATGCKCPQKLLTKITKSDPAWLKEQADKKLKAKEQAKLAMESSQKEKKKKLRRAEKKGKKEIKKKVKKFLSSYNQLENSIRIIETCCDEADDKGDPELKNYIADQRSIFRLDAETLKEDYSSYLTMGKKLTDPSTKSQEIKRITEIYEKAKIVNEGLHTGEASCSTGTDGDFATYEEVQECKKEVKTELKQTYMEEEGRLTPDYFKEVQTAIAAECPVYKCIDDITVMTLELERALPAIKRQTGERGRRGVNKKFNISVAAFIQKKKENELREKRIAAAKEKIALITGTQLYKEMLEGATKELMAGPQALMLMLQLKAIGKSDAEIAQYTSAGIRTYKNCLFDEVGSRFSKEQLKSMATGVGTHNLEIMSIGNKCAMEAADSMARVIQGQG